MISKLKHFLYFPVASYFRFFAGIRLKRWKPKIVVVTGSNGKTTLLHLIESQIGDRAKYSHHANSSFGIPFDILDLHRKSLLKSEWFGLFLKVPFFAFKSAPKEKLYVVEADCDRPGEGKFLGEFLKPNIVVWLSSAKTHAINFESLVGSHPGGGSVFDNIEEAVAYEFGYFLQYAKEQVIINGDSKLIENQIKRTNAKVYEIKKQDSNLKYKVDVDGTSFTIENKTYKFKFLLPEEVFYSIISTKKLCEVLNISFDQSFKNFQMPPGRGSIFEGIKKTILVDSSYNANYSSTKAVLDTFEKISSVNKWAVIGDMLELGESTKPEHERLANLLLEKDFQKIILMGPRVGRYTYPILIQSSKFKVQSDNARIKKFLGPKETLDYILANIKGEEIILFKGARFMEGIIEHLLKNKSDTNKLPRREKIWEIRRKKWGL